MSNIDKLKPGKYAILFRNNWDGEGDTYEAFATLDAEGIWRNEDGDELLEYQGDEVLRAWPLDDGSNVLALLDELEAAERRNTELTEALRQSVIGYKSCLRTGHDRILDLGGDCDAPEVMIAGNPDIQQAEKLLADAAGEGEAS